MDFQNNTPSPARSHGVDTHHDDYRTLKPLSRRMAVTSVLAALSVAPVAVPVAAHAQPKPADAAAPDCGTQKSKACQDALSPAQVLMRLKSGNTRFASGSSTRRDYLSQVRKTGEGQFPLASIVSCIDSRAPAEILFDQGIGDLFNARVAGNIVNEDILGSLEFASRVAGSKVVLVLGHTSCGAIKGACDDVKMGNLTALLGKIRPVVAHTAPEVTERSSKNLAFVEKVAEANVHATVAAIRERSEVLREMEAKGQIIIAGAMYDVRTGKVAWYDGRK